MKDTKTINFRLDGDIYNAVSQIAEEYGVTRSDVIRVALEFSLDKVKDYYTDIRHLNGIATIKQNAFPEENLPIFDDLNNEFENQEWNIISDLVKDLVESDNK